MTIYFVDDDHEDLQLMEEIAISLGHQARLFRNGEDLVKALEADSPVPDLFFIDVVMPKIDGYEILAAVKAHPDYAHIPILIHSAMCEEQCVSKCYELGASYFLRKAYSIHALRSTIEHALSKDWSSFRATREEFLYQH
ncbi:MAG TPA: response regulator [Flavobacterium sp.]|jgi:CheY-like chemotaxis protein